MKIQINITKDILIASTSCQRSTTDCLISRAVRDILPNAHSFGHSIFYNGTGSEGGAEMNLRKKYKFIELPESAYQLMRLFDATTTVEGVLSLPLLSFEIDVPNEVIDMIGLSEVYRVLSESKTLELVKI